MIFLAIVGVYAMLSVFFFVFPGLIWRRRKPQNALFRKIQQTKAILRIAHRGGPRHTTQNTIQGFRKVESVTDCIQLDVCETRDRVLVVHHDHHLKRTCGVDQMVEDYDYSELPPFREEIVLDFAVKGTVKSNQQRIPTLEEVFKQFPNLLMNIELKTPTPSAMAQFIRLLRKYDRFSTTIIGIRSDLNYKLKEQHPEIQNFMNDSKIHRLALAYFLGLAPFLRIDEASLQIPVYSTQFEEWNVGRTPEPQKWKARLFMTMVKVINMVTRPLLWHLKRRGILCFGWVCNTEQAFQGAFAGGFQGIMTDDPFVLDEFLRGKELILS